MFSAGGCAQVQLGAVVTANPDFVAACVQPTVPGQVLPASLGAPARENVIVPRVLELLRQPGWTGDNLLLAGCSYGGTRYPIVAAPFADDESRPSASTGSGRAE